VRDSNTANSFFMGQSPFLYPSARWFCTGNLGNHAYAFILVQHGMLLTHT
jgi:hypothetical protein